MFKKETCFGCDALMMRHHNSSSVDFYECDISNSAIAEVGKGECPKPHWCPKIDENVIELNE
jgi:hypothetical protein